MADPNKRFVVECGDMLHRRVGPAPEREPGDFLTKAEAAIRIINEMDANIEQARDSRRRAVRVLWAERRKAFQ
ncbi:hypothetical protein [Rhizobium arsenicireducens]